MITTPKVRIIPWASMLMILFAFLTPLPLAATPGCQRFLKSTTELPYGWYSKARSFGADGLSEEARQWIRGHRLGNFRIRAFWLRDMAQQASAGELRQIIAQHQSFVARIYGRNRRFNLSSYEQTCCGWEDIWFAAHSGFVSITDARGEIQMMLRVYSYDYDLEYRFHEKAEIPAQILLPSERWTHLQTHQEHVGRALFEIPQPLLSAHHELFAQLAKAHTPEQRRALHATYQLGEVTRYSADPSFVRPIDTSARMVEAIRFLMQQRGLSRVVLKSGKSESSTHDRYFGRTLGFEKWEEAGPHAYFKIDLDHFSK